MTSYLCVNCNTEVKRFIGVEPVEGDRPHELTNDEPTKMTIALATVCMQPEYAEASTRVSGEGSKTHKLYALMRNPLNWVGAISDR